jgi:putative hydrolase of the HAD superfamily
MQRADDIRAVLLDLDDTLTDRWATVQEYARQFVADFGHRFRLADVAVVAAEIAHRDRNGYNHDRALDLAEHEAWISSPGEEALAEHWDYHFAACTRGREGLLATVDALAGAGLKLGVVTNGQTDRQRRKIEALGLRDRLGALVISQELGMAKPDERIFRAAATALGVEPRACMFVGDNPAIDVLGSRAVGMRGVWLRSALPWPKGEAPPHESVSSLSEILTLVGLPLAP